MSALEGRRLQCPRWCDIPVVVVTAKELIEDERRSLERNA
jgi:hypothetical protein